MGYEIGSRPLHLFPRKIIICSTCSAILSVSVPHTICPCAHQVYALQSFASKYRGGGWWGKDVFILADSMNAYERGDINTCKGSNKDPTN